LKAGSPSPDDLKDNFERVRDSQEAEMLIQAARAAASSIPARQPEALLPAVGLAGALEGQSRQSRTALGPSVIRFNHDMTLRWSCLPGDFLIWFRSPNVLVNQLAVIDMWEMRSGESVTITNQFDDLPAWFELHPTEAGESFADLMFEKLNRGYQPREKVDGPNVWRLMAGDRLAWIGESRHDLEPVDGILTVLDCDTCALAAGEPNRNELEAWMFFGSLSKPTQSREDTERCRAATDFVRSMGFPRCWTDSWALG